MPLWPTDRMVGPETETLAGAQLTMFSDRWWVAVALTPPALMRIWGKKPDCAAV